VTNVVGIRRDGSPLSSAVEKAVGDALEALEQKLAEAKGQNDSVFAGYLSMMIMQMRAQKSMLDGLTVTVAAAGKISDEQFVVLRGDFRRTLASSAAGWKDQVLEASNLRSWAIIAATIVGVMVLGLAAGRFAWPGDPPSATCGDYSDGSRWCQMRPAGGKK
jgi:hypothetical protein